MFSTFVGLGRFINCQRPDILSSPERQFKFWRYFCAHFQEVYE